MTTDTKHLTKKQVAILETIQKGADDGDLLDMDMMLSKLPYETTKASMQFSIRALVSRGLIEKAYEIRRGRRRVTYTLTKEAENRFDQTTGEFDVIIEGAEDIESLLESL